VIREADRNERSRSEICQACEIPFCSLSTYLKNFDSVEQQAFRGDDVLNSVRICGAHHGDLESELLEWICHP
jgi:hypothetical protein